MTLTTNLASLPYKDTSMDDLPGEYWEDIPGLDGMYQVSNFGRVKRLERLMYDVLGRPHTFPSIIKVPQVNKDRNMLMKDWSRRLQVSIQVENQTYHFQVARLVYYCFVNKFNLDDANLIVTTRNGDWFDIRPENLMLLTYTQKNHRSYDIGRQKSHFQTNKYKLMEILQVSKMKSRKMISQYDSVGNYIRTYESIMDASRITGIGHSNICYAAKRPDRKAGVFFWRKGDANKINKKEIRDHQEKTRKSYRQKTGKAVTQLDLQGNILASYCAKSLAAELTGIPHKLITQCIEGAVEHACGYLWREGNLLAAAGEPFSTFKLADISIAGRKLTIADCRKRDKTDRGRFSIGIKVTQFDKYGKPIARFNTLKAAADAVNVRYQRIALAVQGKIKAVRGYIWREGYHYHTIAVKEKIAPASASIAAAFA